MIAPDPFADGAPPCPFHTMTDPPTSVTWFPDPDMSIHCLRLLFQESAV